MAGNRDVKQEFDGARINLHRVGQYLRGSGESSNEPERRLISGLSDVAEQVLDLWQAVTGINGNARGGGTIAGTLTELNGLLFRTSRTLPTNGEGTIIEYHLLGTANTLDALINLLEQASGPRARSPAILRKEASSVYQMAQHRYMLALRAPDTTVQPVLSDGNHEGLIQVTRHLHRSVADIAAGVEAWAR